MLSNFIQFSDFRLIKKAALNTVYDFNTNVCYHLITYEKRINIIKQTAFFSKQYFLANYLLLIIRSIGKQQTMLMYNCVS